MVCHICGEPATGQCKTCRGYICNKHSADWKREFCEECENELNWLREKADMKTKQAHYCDFCRNFVEPDRKQNFYVVRYIINERGWNEGYLSLPKCEICNKSYCSKHGQILVRSVHLGFGMGLDEYYHYYCINHLKYYKGVGKHDMKD